MHIVSVNAGLPREVAWGNEVVRTGIFKKPINGRVVLRRLNLDGDAQADLSEGRVTEFDTDDELLAHLDALDADAEGA